MTDVDRTTQRAASQKLRSGRDTAALPVVQEVQRPEVYQLRASDGYPLVVRRFAPPVPSASLVVAGATGVPQGFYRRFAVHAASRGYDVATFDYRGVGASRPASASLRGFRMDYRDWARLDLAAVVAEVAQDSLTGSVDLVGHSYGGHALGLLPDPSLVRAAYFLGTGSGWTGWMSRWEQLRVRFLWHAVGPVATRVAGYLPWSRLGLGEDLPLDVYRQWKHWCSFPGYWFDDPEVAAQMRSYFDRVTSPITATTAIDDRWIPPAARDAFLVGYRKATVTTRDLRPTELGLATIGHMGYFRAGAETLWDQVLATFTTPRATGGLSPR